MKVRNKVKIIDTTGYSNEKTIGLVGTIIEIEDAEPVTWIAVEFDVHIAGHAGFCVGVQGKVGHCWNYPVESVELVNEIEILDDADDKSLKEAINQAIRNICEHK